MGEGASLLPGWYSEPESIGALPEWIVQLQRMAIPCPHCRVPTPGKITTYWEHKTHLDVAMAVIVWECLSCHEVFYALARGKKDANNQFSGVVRLIYPQIARRPPCPPEVIEPFRSDYEEACAVLPYSAKASAALSRRCLQNLIQRQANISPKLKLWEQIRELAKSPGFPSELAHLLDVIRHCGNGSAHPWEQENTREIIDIEPCEAEWALEVLEALFDYWFVAPIRTEARKAALNQKLAAAKQRLIP